MHGKISHYERAVRSRATAIARAKASIEEKFAPAIAEARRLWKLRKPGRQPKDRRLV